MEPNLAEAYKRLENIVAAHAKGNRTELMKVYNVHAEFYDKDIDIMKWDGPRLIADSIKKHLPENATILDICSGTGAVAQHLGPEYINIDCIDGSHEMVSIALKKRLYRNYFCQIVPKDSEVSLRSGLYDATVVSGGILVWKEMLRLTKTGGYCMAALLDFPKGLFMKALKSLEEDFIKKGFCKIIADTFIEEIELDRDGKWLPGRLIIFQKC